MDIYNYLNSIDVSKYLKSIKYSLSPVESAFIIEHNNSLSIYDKELAFKGLIKESEDTCIKERRLCRHFDSLHTFLIDYIELEHRLIKEFNTKEKAVYRISYHIDDEVVEDDVVYDSLSKCLKEAKTNKYFNNYHRLTINKLYINKDNKYFSIVYDRNDSPLKIREYNILNNKKDRDIFYAFDGMWFNIPVPFVRGDIVKNSIKHRGYDACPFVLIDTVNNNINDVIKDNGDNVDMCAWGYFKDNDSIFYEGMDNYIDLEYTSSDDIVLNSISDYLKGKISIKEVLSKYKTSLSKEDNKDKISKLKELLENE